MKAGMDFGSSLIKVVWKHDDEFRFASTADGLIAEIIQQMKDNGVRRVYVAGVGYNNSYSEVLEGLEVKSKEGDPIMNEKILQAEGTKSLLRDQGYDPNNCLIVSIGTGTSYTIVRNGEVIPFPIGSSLGGGYIEGLSGFLGVREHERLAELAGKGTPLDMHIKDRIPKTEGTDLGEFVLSNFGKGSDSPRIEDAFASIVSSVAVPTVQNLILIDMIPDFKVPHNVVYIGSPIKHIPKLRELLEKYTGLIGRKAHFPDKGEFALALGAYHSSV